MMSAFYLDFRIEKQTPITHHSNDPNTNQHNAAT